MAHRNPSVSIRLSNVFAAQELEGRQSLFYPQAALSSVVAGATSRDHGILTGIL